MVAENWWHSTEIRRADNERWYHTSFFGCLTCLCIKKKCVRENGFDIDTGVMQAPVIGTIWQQIRSVTSNTPTRTIRDAIAFFFDRSHNKSKPNLSYEDTLKAFGTENYYHPASVWWQLAYETTVCGDRYSHNSPHIYKRNDITGPSLSALVPNSRWLVASNRYVAIVARENLDLLPKPVRNRCAVCVSGIDFKDPMNEQLLKDKEACVKEMKRLWAIAFQRSVDLRADVIIAPPFGYCLGWYENVNDQNDMAKLWAKAFVEAVTKTVKFPAPNISNGVSSVYPFHIRLCFHGYEDQLQSYRDAISDIFRAERRNLINESAIHDIFFPESEWFWEYVSVTLDENLNVHTALLEDWDNFNVAFVVPVHPPNLITGEVTGRWDVQESPFLEEKLAGMPRFNRRRCVCGGGGEG